MATGYKAFAKIGREASNNLKRMQKEIDDKIENEKKELKEKLIFYDGFLWEMDDNYIWWHIGKESHSLRDTHVSNRDMQEYIENGLAQYKEDETLVKKYERINKEWDEANDKLQEYLKNQKTTSGLVSNETMADNQYKILKRNYDISFNKVRNFNKENKEFVKEQSKEKRRKILEEKIQKDVAALRSEPFVDNWALRDLEKAKENKDYKFTYQMLGRLKSDCDYFLGAGNGHEKHLWAGNIEDQIKEMKRLWNELPESEKPEWLSMQDILNYESKMKQKKGYSEEIYDPYNIENPKESEIDKTYNAELGKKYIDIYNENENIYITKFSISGVQKDGMNWWFTFNNEGYGGLDFSRNLTIQNYNRTGLELLENLKARIIYDYEEKNKPELPVSEQLELIKELAGKRKFDDFISALSTGAWGIHIKNKQLQKELGLIEGQKEKNKEIMKVNYSKFRKEWIERKKVEKKEADENWQKMKSENAVNQIMNMAIQQETEIQNEIKQKYMFADEFFTQNPSKILGEAKMVSDRFGKPTMAVKGDLSNLAGIDAPDILEPSNYDIEPFVSELNETLSELITTDNIQNFEIAVESEEKKIAKKSIEGIRKRKKKSDSECVDCPEVEQTMIGFDEFLSKYNPQINQEELECWLYYNELKGNTLGGGWSRYAPRLVDENWRNSMLEKNYLCYDFKNNSWIYAPVYYSGNISGKIAELMNYRDTDKKEIWQRQYDKLNEIKPKPLALTSGVVENRLIISPISEFAREYKISKLNDGTVFEEEISLVSAFLKYIYTIPETDFELPVRPSEIEQRYIDNTPDRSKRISKEEKFEAKKNARLEGDRLFQKFLYDELHIEDKTKIEYLWNSKYNALIDVNYNKIPVAFECSNQFKKGSLNFRPAQIEGIAFQSINGSGVIAYGVGVGKTATLIGTVAHLYQSNQAKRALIIVPNPTYPKWIGEFSGIFDSKGKLIGAGVLPQYKINDFKNLGVDYLQKVVDKDGNFIPIEDYSITIMTYEALEKIGFNEEKNASFISEMMSILDTGSDSSKARDVAILKGKAEGMLGKAQKETLIDFDMFDFDFIGIDEAHNFKNVFTSVKGEESGEGGKGKQYEIQGSVSNRGIKAFLMTQWVINKTGGKNVCLLTATPFTNNPLEVFSMLALCSYKELKNRGINNLREFFDTYVKQSYEIVYGSDFQFKEKAVIKQWNNRISLQQLIFSFINYKSGEDAGIVRPNKIVLPLFKEKSNGLVFDLPEEMQISTFLTPTEKQREYLKDIEAFVLKEAKLRDICDLSGVEEGCEPPESLKLLSNLSDEDAEAGRTLRALSFSRQVTLSPYLYACNNMCANANDLSFYKEYVETSPKILYVMNCIKSVKDWHTKHNEEASGQIIYMDAGKQYFGLIKEYLIREIGYNPDEVAFITSAVSQDKREDIKKGFLSGDIKIIIGTSSIKEGIDLQERTSVLYNCWLDWRPTDVVQLEGRAWRFGNKYANVRIVTPLIENSIDPFMFQKLEEKTARINDIFNREGRNNVLNVEEFNPEELKNGLLTDPIKKAKEIIRQESKAFDVEIKKLDSKIEGISEINGLKKTLERIESNLAWRVKNAYDYLLRYYSPRTVEIEKSNGEIEEKIINAREWLTENDMPNVESVNNMDLIIKFGKYSDKLTSQSEFSWDIERYRDIKKKLINFEKSILQPRNLSLSDDLERIKEQLLQEKGELEKKKEAINNEENKSRLIERYSKEIMELNRKKKPLSERVNAFASLNNKCLTEILEYKTEQTEKIEAFETVKEIEKIEQENEKAEQDRIEAEKQELQKQKAEYLEAIETLKMLMELTKNKKEIAEYKEAIETLEMIMPTEYKDGGVIYGFEVGQKAIYNGEEYNVVKVDKLIHISKLTPEPWENEVTEDDVALLPEVAEKELIII